MGLRHIAASRIGKCERAGRSGEVGASQSSAFPSRWAGRRHHTQPIECVCPQNTWCNSPICQRSATTDDVRKSKVGGRVEILIAKSSNRHK
ncbi:hypothetical protein QQF64_033561 [Cirrhinus molitorella]|uniref:Uncharacterized protein n=1 Tax=Cirrhinus molitorella TaxID=172907 RepID=A0ABR3MU93_9TELE